jgi:transcription termination factor Rho
MHEIATLKGKKLPELQEIAKNIGIRRITGLKKMELIYQIIDTVAASPVDEKDSSPSPKPQPDKAVGEASGGKASGGKAKARSDREKK